MNLSNHSLECFKYIINNIFFKEIELRDTDKSFFNKIKECYNLYDNYKFNFTLIDVVKSKNKLDESLMHNHHLNNIYDNKFISKNIYEFLESHDLKVYESNNNLLKVVTLNTNLSKYENLYAIIETIKCMSQKTQDIQIFFYSTPLNKELIYDIKSLNPININSGSTYRDGPITLWRDEELVKVLIHEMIHALRIDFTHMTPGFNELTNRIRKLVNINGDIKLYEAYTETVAIIINTVIVTIRSGFSMRKLQNLINIETNFTLYQTAKILKFFDFKSINELFDKTKSIIQTTSGFSYYMIKGALLCNLFKFIDFIKNDINFNDALIKKFGDIIEESLFMNDFIIAIDKYIEIIKLDDSFIAKTMRMSCLELNVME